MVVIPSLKKISMPYQSASRFRKTQETNGDILYVTDPESARPSPCPYCQSYHAMHIHQYRFRYGVSFQGFTYRMLVIRYLCCSCGRTITVLPSWVHTHRIFEAVAILLIIGMNIVTGHTVTGTIFSRSMQRDLMDRWRMRRSEKMNLWPDKEEELGYLLEQPMFAILPHNPYVRMPVGSIAPNSRTSPSHQRLPVAMYQNP